MEAIKNNVKGNRFKIAASVWMVIMLLGLPLEIIYLSWCYDWWGGMGFVLGIFLTPLGALFPVIYLFKVGFSGLFFGIWGAYGAAYLITTYYVGKYSENWA